jgi:GntR family transcriptional regulator
MKRLTLDKTSPIPLHQQLANEIKMAIRSHQYPPGHKLPTEEELCQHFGISRPVVRQAYKQLIEEELIYRHKGKGSFVLKNNIRYTILDSIASLNHQIDLNNMQPSIHVIGMERIECTPEFRHQFELVETSPIIRIKRIYYGDESPLFYIELHLPEIFYPNMIDNLSPNQALSNYVKENFDFRTVQSKRHVKAITFNDVICDYLNLPKKSAGFRIETTSYDQFGRIVEISHTYVKGIGTSMQLNYF